MDDDAHAADENWAGKGFSSVQFGDTAECPGCGRQAEPEQDGDLQYYECVCGVAFGYSQEKQEETCAAGLSLAHLVTLGEMTSAEEKRLLFGRSGPAADGVFLGSLIPMRPEDN